MICDANYHLFNHKAFSYVYMITVFGKYISFISNKKIKYKGSKIIVQEEED